MKISIKHVLICVASTFMISCSVETETHSITTPVLELKATGPLFQGSNTATATWEYSLEALFPEMSKEIVVESAKVTSIKMIPKPNVNYPVMGKVVMEMKPKETNMLRIGLLENNFKNEQSNNLSVAAVQGNFDKAFKDGRLTFVADFELLEEDYYDDLSFNLVVTFKIFTRK